MNLEDVTFAEDRCIYIRKKGTRKGLWYQWYSCGSASRFVEMATVVEFREAKMPRFVLECHCHRQVEDIRTYFSIE